MVEAGVHHIEKMETTAKGRKTAAMMFEGWRSRPLRDIMRIASGQVDPKDTQIAQQLSVGPDNLRSGGGWEAKSVKTAGELEQISGKYAFDRNAILYSKIRPNLNKIAIADFDGICSADMYPMWVKDDRQAARDFIYYVMNSDLFVEQATSRSFRTGLPKINRLDLESIEIPLPPLPEQRKIAEILRTWDEAIEKLEALRAAKREQLTALTQKLFGLGGAFPRKWDRRPLSAISTRVRRENDGGRHPVMTISAKSGFRLQSDKFSRDMAGSSVDRYIVLHRGEFAYNKGNSLTAPYGCIFLLDRPSALVPFVYFCFTLHPGINGEFFAHLFAAGALNRQLSRLINSGVRNDGLLNLDPDDFFRCEVPVPSESEQSAIASVMTVAKQEIDLLDKELEAVIRQKRGLMQKLLTGKIRVPEAFAELSPAAD